MSAILHRNWNSMRVRRFLAVALPAQPPDRRAPKHGGAAPPDEPPPFCKTYGQRRS